MTRYLAHILFILSLLSAWPVAAEEPEFHWGGHGRRWAAEPGMPPPPYGDFCPRRHADHYGARQPVATPDEARKRLSRFFALPAEQILLRKERKMGYIADVVRPDGTLFDRVIIDKRTGRIRSIR